MESPKINSTTQCRNRIYLCGLANYPNSWGRYRAENGNLRKLGLNYRHGTVFPPTKYLNPIEATVMERTEMYSLSRWRKPTYLCGPANYPVSWGGRMGPRTETCVNWSGPIAIVPCLHQGDV